jgi:hypothetical protein
VLAAREVDVAHKQSRREVSGEAYGLPYELRGSAKRVLGVWEVRGCEFGEREGLVVARRRGNGGVGHVGGVR